MKKKRSKSLRGVGIEERLIDEALDEAARDAVQKHKETGLPLAVWKDGKTEWVQPDEVDVQQNGDRRAAQPRAKQ